MSRNIDQKVDALFVEGPDDGAVVNALIERCLGIGLRGPRLVKAREEGGGSAWALHEFERVVGESPDRARIGVIIDRDGIDGRADNWPRVREWLMRHGVEDIDGPRLEGHIVNRRFGVWMWPDNVATGDLEHFVRGMVPPSAVLDYAEEACRTAKASHGAEYDAAHARKAALKVRSIWREASAAGGYGHLIRNLPIVESPASQAFLAWFRTLFLTA